MYNKRTLVHDCTFHKSESNFVNAAYAHITHVINNICKYDGGIEKRMKHTNSFVYDLFQKIFLSFCLFVCFFFGWRGGVRS